MRNSILFPLLFFSVLIAQPSFTAADIATTERYCNIPLEMLEEHFPSYAKQAENDVRDTLIRDTEPFQVEVASR